MLPRSTFIAVFLACLFCTCAVTFSDVIQKDNEQEVVSEVNYVEPALAPKPKIEPDSRLTEPATFGIIALAIAIGGGMLVRRKSN